MSEYDMSPGVLVSFNASRRWALGDGSWFASGSGGVTVATLKTDGPNAESARYTATDLRIGGMFGKTLAGKVSPYVLCRLFGGPAIWNVADTGVTGSDPSHLQLGAGVAVNIPAGLTIVLDVSAVGEQSASAGLTWRL